MFDESRVATDFASRLAARTTDLTRAELDMIADVADRSSRFKPYLCEAGKKPRGGVWMIQFSGGSWMWGLAIFEAL